MALRKCKKAKLIIERYCCGKRASVRAQKFFENICNPDVLPCVLLAEGMTESYEQCLLRNEQRLNTQSPGLRLADLSGEGQLGFMQRC